MRLAVDLRLYVKGQIGRIENYGRHALVHPGRRWPTARLPIGECPLVRARHSAASLIVGS
jgi:hypothetical protein